MSDPKKQAESDQAIATLADLLPRTWWSLYRGCIAEGFSCVQALDLVKTYIDAQRKSE